MVVVMVVAMIVAMILAMIVAMILAMIVIVMMMAAVMATAHRRIEIGIEADPGGDPVRVPPGQTLAVGLQQRAADQQRLCDQQGQCGPGVQRLGPDLALGHPRCRWIEPVGHRQVAEERTQAFAAPGLGRQAARVDLMPGCLQNRPLAGIAFAPRLPIKDNRRHDKHPFRLFPGCQDNLTGGQDKAFRTGWQMGDEVA